MKSRSLIAEPFANIINSQSVEKNTHTQAHTNEVCVRETGRKHLVASLWVGTSYLHFKVKCLLIYIFVFTWIEVRLISSIFDGQVLKQHFTYDAYHQFISMEYQIKKMNWVWNSHEKIKPELNLVWTCACVFSSSNDSGMFNVPTQLAARKSVFFLVCIHSFTTTVDL